MAAPNSSPELSVVSEPEVAEQAAPKSPAPEEAAPAASKKTERSGPTIQRGVPLWVLVAAVLSGVVLFFGQYIRAEELDARVQSLRAELEEAGEHLAAYQTHLDSVRLGVGELTARLGSLKALVDLDPLAPPPPSGTGEMAETSLLPAVSAPPPSLDAAVSTAPTASRAESIPPSAPILGEGAPVEPPPSVEPLGPVSTTILGDALSIPFASHALRGPEAAPPFLF